MNAAVKSGWTAGARAARDCAQLLGDARRALDDCTFAVAMPGWVASRANGVRASARACLRARRLRKRGALCERACASRRAPRVTACSDAWRAQATCAFIISLSSNLTKWLSFTRLVTRKKEFTNGASARVANSGHGMKVIGAKLARAAASADELIYQLV